MKKSSKVIIALILVLTSLMSIGLTACGEKSAVMETPPVEIDQPGTEAPTQKVDQEEEDTRPFCEQVGVWSEAFTRSNPYLNGLADNKSDMTYKKYKNIEASVKGTIEKVEYDTYYYAYDLKNGDVFSHETPATKQAFVYLPAGYDETKQYNILYLYHGGGDTEYAWFKNIDRTNNDDSDLGSGYAVNILDNMIANGDIEPLIVVTPSFYMNGDNEKLLGELDLTQTDVAYLDLQDLMAVVESKYSTYAEDVSDEGLIASRNHRAMAGLSMGCCTTWRSGVGHLINKISWFALMSGGPDPTSVDLAKEIISTQVIPAVDKANEEGYQINMMLNFNGTLDQYLEGHIESHKLFLEHMKISDALKAGENYDFVVANVGHNFTGWNLFLYDLLQVFFK